MAPDNLKVGTVVNFQAYAEHEPVEGRIKRIGTLHQLGKHQMDYSDKRVFYELETISGGREHVFTCTTIEWISLKKEKGEA